VWVTVRAYPVDEYTAPCCRSFVAVSNPRPETKLSARASGCLLLCVSARSLSGSAGSLLTVYALFCVCGFGISRSNFDQNIETNQYNAPVSFAGSLAGFWLLGANAQLLAWGADRFDAVALDIEKVELVGLDLEHLGRRIWADKGRLGQRHALPLRFWLLN
jgi:hypothetical protein